MAVGSLNYTKLSSLFCAQRVTWALRIFFNFLVFCFVVLYLFVSCLFISIHNLGNARGSASPKKKKNQLLLPINLNQMLFLTFILS